MMKNKTNEIFRYPEFNKIEFLSTEFNNHQEKQEKKSFNLFFFKKNSVIQIRMKSFIHFSSIKCLSGNGDENENNNNKITFKNPEI